jgi:DNA-binding transcriptional MerR regulator
MLNVELKKTYSSREVAALTGLTARQLQWWDARRLLRPAIPPRRTAAGGFTERRYTPVELLELLVLAELRRHGFTVQKIRRLLETLQRRFGVRLFETIGGAGPVTLLTDGKDIYARTNGGELFNLLRAPSQPLLVLGQDLPLKELSARARPARRRRITSATLSGRRRRGLPPDAG